MTDPKITQENLEKILESTPIGELAAQFAQSQSQPQVQPQVQQQPQVQSQAQTQGPVQGNEPNIPNLDQIINQITSNGDFKEMMNNVSEGLQLPLKEVTIPEASEDGEAANKNSESFYDLCCTFLSDSEGNSIGDILTQINQNLSSISKTLVELKESKDNN